jgi:hypothetical protein
MLLLLLMARFFRRRTLHHTFPILPAETKELQALSDDSDRSQRGAPTRRRPFLSMRREGFIYPRSIEAMRVIDEPK